MRLGVPRCRVCCRPILAIQQAMQVWLTAGARRRWAMLAAFVEEMKASGVVADALKRHRIQGGIRGPAA